MSPQRWKAITPSQSAWESDALEYLRAELPDHELYMAWSNFEFLADDGTINEIDALVLTPLGFFLIEIKSRPGILNGDVHMWTWTTGGHRFTYDNPLFLANRKARKLVSLLKRRKAAAKSSIPYLEAVGFCSARGLQKRLTGAGRTNVFLRDTEKSPGILQALINRNGLGQERNNAHRLDKPTARAVFRALEEAGIRPTQIGSGQRDCARCPSHTTGRAVFRIRRLNAAALPWPQDPGQPRSRASLSVPSSAIQCDLPAAPRRLPGLLHLGAGFASPG